MQSDEEMRSIQAKPKAPGVARMVRAFAAAAPAIWDLDVETARFQMSDRVFEIYGLPKETPVDFDTFLSATHPHDAYWASHIRQAAKEAQTLASHRYRIRRIDNGELRWIHAHISAETGADGRVLGFTGTIEDVTDEMQAVHALIESEERLRLAIEAGQMAVWEVDLEAGSVTVTPELNLLFGFPIDAKPAFADYRSRYAPGEVERLATEGATLEVVRARFARGDFEPRRDGVQAAGTKRTQVQAEVSIVVPGGKTKRLLYRAQYAFSMEGRPKITGLLVDITERKLAEERLAVVARELQHRVKNSLAVVQSIANQSARSHSDPRDAMRTFTARLRALSAATDLMLDNESSETKIDDIVQRITKPYRFAASDPFVIGGADVVMPGKLASALCLVLHELCTNAIKYGALSSPGGRVMLSWRRLSGGEIIVDWKEEGGPAVLPPARTGFGTTLLETLVKHELAGSLKLDFEPAGLGCQITIGPQSS